MIEIKLRTMRKILFFNFSLLLMGLTLLELFFGAWLIKDGWRGLENIGVLRNANFAYDATRLGYTNPYVNFKTDLNGLRGSCKNLQFSQIFTIGGSTTKQRYITQGETWQDLLEVKFNQDFSKNLCIANAGIDGHSTYGHLQSYKYWFPLIKGGVNPKYVIVYAGINDAPFRDDPIDGKLSSVTLVNNKNQPTLYEKLHHAMVSNSALWSLKEGIKSQLSPIAVVSGHGLSNISQDIYTETSLSPLTPKLTDINVGRFHDRYEKLLKVIIENGGKPICVTQPHNAVIQKNGQLNGVKFAFTYGNEKFNGIDFDYSIKRLSPIISHLCKSNGGYFIDAANIDLSLNDFYDTVHLNPIGTQKFASYLYEQLKSLNILNSLAADINSNN